MDQSIELIVAQQDDGKRIDAYLRENTDFSRSRIAALMAEGAVKVTV